MSKLDQLRLLGANKRIERAKPNPFEDAARGRDPAPSNVGRAKGDDRSGRATAGPAKSSRGGVDGHAKRPSLANGILGTKPLLTAMPAPAAGIKPGPRETKSKGGRPLAKDADKALMQTQPWKAAGMSRRTWYRRQAEKAGKDVSG